MKTIYERNYNKLLKLAPNLLALKEGQAIKSKSDGYMDLNLDILAKSDKKIRIALSHYYQQNGDTIADPDMEIYVLPQLGMIEALTYQDFFGYKTVYDSTETRFHPSLKKSLNQFLSTWLTNCSRQGHKLI